ncbi:TolC family protein, partial [bacterium]|nr:TolC family protein [bacterium]
MPIDQFRSSGWQRSFLTFVFLFAASLSFAIGEERTSEISTDLKKPENSSLPQTSILDNRIWEPIKTESNGATKPFEPKDTDEFRMLPPLPPGLLSLPVTLEAQPKSASSTSKQSEMKGDEGTHRTNAYERYFNPGSVEQAVPTEKNQQAIGLDQVINLCLLSDPVLRAGFEAISQANADALQASLLPNPVLYTDIQMLPFSRPFTVTRQGGPPQQDALVTYPIDWFVFGKKAANLASVSLGVRISEANYNDLIRQRVTAAAIAYYDILEAAELVGLAKQEVASFRTVLDVTQKAVESGGRPRVELQRIQLNLLNSERSARDAEVLLTQAKTRLQPLVGRSVNDPFVEVTGTLNVDPAPPNMNLEDAYVTAVENRPDLQALRWRLQQMRAQILVQRRAAFPNVAITGGWTLQYQTKDLQQPNAN